VIVDVVVDGVTVEELPLLTVVDVAETLDVELESNQQAISDDYRTMTFASILHKVIAIQITR
jgi:hypothetical protein